MANSSGSTEGVVSLKLGEEDMVTKFAEPIRSYDVHIYFYGTQLELAKELREDIIRLFPDVKVFKLWEKPIGPHPVNMFEVDLKTPAQFARFVPWLNVNRRGLSALIHPNTGFPFLDHTRNALWLGQQYPLDTACLQQTSDTYGI